MDEIAESWDSALWLADLQKRLTIAGEGYLRFDPDDDGAESLSDVWPPIPANRTSFAWLALLTVINSLQSAPGMADHVGLAPLHDLVADLIDLGQGGNPRLLQPVKGVGRGKESSRRRLVREHALLFVTLLTTVEVKATEACQEVAKLLARHGHSARKGAQGSLSWKTVESWWTRSRQADFSRSDPKMVQFLERNTKRIIADLGESPSLVQVRAFIEDVARSPSFQSKA